MAYNWDRGWTPLPGGDLGSSKIDHDELLDDTRDNELTRKAGNGNSNSLMAEESYEMNEVNDQRSPFSTVPLIHTSSIQESIEDASIGKRTLSSRFSQRRRQFSGWKVGVVVCAITASIVCLLNIIVTIWAVSSHPVSNGLSFLYTGSCTEVANMSLWIHLAINAISTLLLSASNYTMQVISSPTRKEVDIAHQKFKWLDIGIPSTRNLFSISRARVVMWCMLALSSIPLHLMYNTAIFSSMTANEYDYMVVKTDFLSADYVVNTTAPSFGANSALQASYMHELVVNNTFKRYDAEACMTAYATTFASKIRNVLLVTNDDNFNETNWYGSYWNPEDELPWAWICGDDYTTNPYLNNEQVCTLAKAKAGIDNWTVFEHKIDYCMVEETVEHCQLRFSLGIMIIVIIANMTKVGIMILTWWKFRTPTLTTIGDAIASFLEDRDPTTKGICLSSRADIQKGKWKDSPPNRWVPKSQFWFKAASIKRWVVCISLCLIFIIIGIVLLKTGMGSLAITTVSQMWDLGFGVVNSSALVSSSIVPKGLIPTILLANTPQAILSFLYMTYNGLFSCKLAAYEWTLFAHNRMTLRVTRPRGMQRSTYYLQLPYYYAIPLLFMSGLLHWLMSQSLFLALIDLYDDHGIMNPQDAISSIGYSCIAIFFSILVGTLAVVGGILNGFRRYTADIPLVGSCSAAISACCHRPDDDTSAHLQPLQWGSIDQRRSEDVGHCTLTSMDVSPPLDGSLYAGSSKGSKAD